MPNAHDEYLKKREISTPDALERLLDEAFSSYSEVKASSGMEARLLALSAEEQESRAFLPLRLPLAYAVPVGIAAALMFAVLLRTLPANHERRPSVTSFAHVARLHAGSIAQPVQRLRATPLKTTRVLANTQRQRRSTLVRVHPLPLYMLTHQERLLLQLAASPQKNALDQTPESSIAIPPIAINAVQMEPLTDTPSQP